MPASLKRKVAIGVAWMTASRVTIRILGFVSTLVLARILAPADFGLVAMATAVAAGLELLTTFNFETALVQKAKLDRTDYDTAWTLNVLLGCAVAVALVLLASPTAKFYREARIEHVMFLLALKYVFDSALNTGTVDFRRNLDFRREYVLQVVPKVSAIAVTLPLAYWLRDHRALLAGMLSGSATGLLLGYVIHPHRPRMCLSEARSLFGFSRWLLLNNLVSFLRTRSADFIIGRALGRSSLGTFSIGAEIASLPSTELVAPINRVLFPSYVLLADQQDRLRAGFRATLGVIALVILPASVGLSAVADPLVRLMLGEKWLETIPLISLLALAGTIEVLLSNTGSVYNAIGRPRMIALTGALLAVTLVPALLYATFRFGLIGTAWAVLLHSLVVALPVTLLLFIRTTPIRLVDVALVCWRPLMACSVMYFAVTVFLNSLPATNGLTNIVLSLIGAVSVGIVTYAVAASLLWLLSGRRDGAESLVLGRMQHLLSRLGVRAAQ